MSESRVSGDSPVSCTLADIQGTDAFRTMALEALRDGFSASIIGWRHTPAEYIEAAGDWLVGVMAEDECASIITVEDSTIAWLLVVLYHRCGALPRCFSAQGYVVTGHVKIGHHWTVTKVL